MELGNPPPLAQKSRQLSVRTRHFGGLVVFTQSYEYRKILGLENLPVPRWRKSRVAHEQFVCNQGVSVDDVQVDVNETAAVSKLLLPDFNARTNFAPRERLLAAVDEKIHCLTTDKGGELEEIYFCSNAIGRNSPLLQGGRKLV